MAPVPVVVCGSTVDGEEERMLLQCLSRTCWRAIARAVMILAPRRPERFPVKWRQLLEQSGHPFLAALAVER